jgi:hypothetical protein
VLIICHLFFREPLIYFSNGNHFGHYAVKFFHDKPNNGPPSCNMRAGYEFMNGSEDPLNPD